MSNRMKIWAVTSLCPTAAEPYRGAAIWSTLRNLNRYADIEAYCPLASYPLGLRPKHFRYHPLAADTSRYGIPSRTVKFFAVPLLTRMLNGDLIYRALRRNVSASRPDVILSYYVYPEGYAAVRLGEALGVPTVVGSRGSDLRLIDNNPRVQQLTRDTLKRAAAVLSVSGDLADIAIRLGASPERVYTVRNGIDHDVFHFRHQAGARAALGISSGVRLVLFVGWLSALKGTPQLVQAVARLNQPRAEDWRLALIGEGQLEQNLRALAHELGVESRIEFLGGRHASDIAAWMQAADCLCLPSESEGCPNVIVEALSCGTPVVATSVGGVPELVNEASGVLLPANDAESIVQGLRRALRSQWDRCLIARENCRSWDQVALDTYRICERAGHRTAIVGSQTALADC